MASDEITYIVLRDYANMDEKEPPCLKYLATKIAEEVNGQRVAIYVMSHDERARHTAVCLKKLLRERMKKPSKVSMIDTCPERIQRDENFAKIHLWYAEKEGEKVGGQVLIFVCDNHYDYNLAEELLRDEVERVDHHSALVIKFIDGEEKHHQLTPPDDNS